MQRSLKRCAALVGLVLALFVAAVAAAHPRPGLGDAPLPVASVSDRPRLQRTGRPGDPLPPRLENQQPSHFTGWLVVAIVVAMLVLVLMFLAIRFVRRVLARISVTRDEEEPPRLDVPPPNPAIQLQQVANESLDDLVASDDVGDAITACWRRLEDLAEHSGIARERWQTASDYTVAVLSSTAAPEAELRILEDLFEAARYGGQPPGEEERRRAVAALMVLREVLEGALVPVGWSRS